MLSISPTNKSSNTIIRGIMQNVKKLDLKKCHVLTP